MDTDCTQPASCPGISVLIRTFNSAQTLKSVIDRLGLAEKDELVIVDSGSKDDTLRIAQDYRARIVRTEGPFNYSRSLNLGFEAAKNDWVLVLSSHCIPVEAGHLAIFKAALNKMPGNVAVVYGPYRYSAKGRVSFSGSEPLSLDFKRWDHHREWFGSNCNALYRKTYWREHFFQEHLPTGEDLEWFLWALRRGLNVGQAPKACVLYRHCGGIRRMFTKGYQESAMIRVLLSSGKMSVGGLGVGLGSFFKKFLLGEIPFRTFQGQSAQQLGAFLGWRFAKIQRFENQTATSPSQSGPPLR